MKQILNFKPECAATENRYTFFKSNLYIEKTNKQQKKKQRVHASHNTTCIHYIHTHHSFETIIVRSSAMLMNMEQNKSNTISKN